MTAPPLHSLPVPDAVTMTPSGSGVKSTGSPRVQNFSQTSSFETAASATALQQSITEPPPAPSISETLFARASAAPSSTFA